MAVKQNRIFHFIYQVASRFKIFTDKDCIKMHFWGKPGVKIWLQCEYGEFWYGIWFILPSHLTN